MIVTNKNKRCKTFRLCQKLIAHRVIEIKIVNAIGFGLTNQLPVVEDQRQLTTPNDSLHYSPKEALPP